MTISLLSVAAGLIALAGGGELLVRGAVSLAERLGVSRLMIGLTLVGFGTSTPELVTSLQAAFVGSPGIAIGNVVGSNIANVLLILGITALIRPVAASPAAFARDGTMLAIATGLCVGASFLDELGRGIGIVFLGALAAYIVVTYLRERHEDTASGQLHAAEAAEAPHASRSLLASSASLVGGFVLTILGARLLVDGSIEIARGFDISETVIGLTVVAAGTSLPELVASMAAARRGHSDIALGNIIGSSLYNILGILGVTAAVHPIAIPPEIRTLDIWVMAGATAALLLTSFTGWRITRGEGAALLGCYLVYMGYLAAY